MTFEDKEQLRQLLLELHYELLDEEEAEPLRAAIASDPDVATEWAATLRWAGKLADAAKIELTPETMAKPTDLEFVAAEPAGDGEVTGNARTVKPSSDGSATGQDDSVAVALVDSAARLPQPESPSQSKWLSKSNDGATAAKRSGRSDVRWWMRSTGLAVTAAAIGMMVIGSWYSFRLPASPLATVRIQAQPIPVPAASGDREFRLLTTRLDGSVSSLGGFPVTPASISFSVLASNQILFSGQSKTDQKGIGRIALPPDLAIPTDAMLRVTAHANDGQVMESSIEVPLEPTRCLTFLTVDRPVYRPGEVVYFRSLTLQRRSLIANADVPIRYELIDPSGAVVSGAWTEGVTDRGVGNGAFSIPAAAPGGSYTLVAKSLDDFFPEERCEFQVRAYRVPRFKKELEFRKRSYGPGESLQADFSVVRAEGGPLADASVLITAMLDGEVIFQSTATTSSSGTCLIEFDLPSLIREGKGQLSVIVDDGGTRETQAKTIPIQLGRVVVDFYPEGGYLVDGLTNRVYFVARDTLGHPIDLAGEILDRSGQSVAKVKTVRDGMGRFEMVPRRGERYTLKVNRPMDVTNLPRLPAVVKDLPVIDTGKGVFDANDDITLSVRSTKTLLAVVRAVCRGQLVGEIEVELRAGENRLSVPIRSDVGGVIRLTVFDNSKVPALPLAERLVYRRQEKKLQVEVMDRESALERSPGEPVRLNLQVRNEIGEPTPAVLGIAVVDDAALSLDDRERPQIRTHFLLTSEIEKPEDLEHANFYLSDQEGAAQSLDLLLGTQGWRRFVSGDPAQANVDFREQLIRLLELDGEPNHSVAVQRFDNSRHLLGQWERYQATARMAWQRLLAETRTLLLLVLGFWLLLIAFHLRRRASFNLTAWLLVASSSLLIYGCGAASESTSRAVDSVVATGSMVESDALKMEESEAFEMEGSEAFEIEASAGMAERSAPASESPVTNRMEDLTPDSPSESAAETLWKAIGVNGSDALADGDLAFEEQSRRLQGAKNKYFGDAGRLISEEDLLRLFASRGLDPEALADQLLDELRFPIRQYAHQYTSDDEGVRQDFAETLCWQPLVVTDSQGRASIRFDLSDSVTTFRVSVDAHAAEGRIGSAAEEIRSRLPFQIEPKMPLEVTTGDTIQLPVAVINATHESADIQMQLQSDAALRCASEDRSRTVQVNGSDRTREYFTLDVVSGLAESDASVVLRGQGTRHSDAIRRRVHVSPAGYPMRRSIAGRLSSTETIALPIPADRIDGSLAVTVRAYPSPLADVMSGIDSILREPHGCFEQTSATNYPNAMALLYLQQTKTSNSEVAQRAIGMLDRGYQKLMSFECDHRGYEWFGSDPGHEALSAFGLMQFTDMSKVMQVSKEMMARTRQWLLARRDGKGGFQRNPRHLHVWSVQQAIVNAYILWAITEADVAAGQPMRATSELSQELNELNRVARSSQDPYLVALSAATLMNVKRTEEALFLMDKLSSMQNEDGHLQGKTTITSSGGLSLKMETTALATLAWAKSPHYRTQAQQAARWMTQNRSGNSGFGSTQATVLALKALLAVRSDSNSIAGGTLQVELNGEVVGFAKLPEEPASGSVVEITGLGAEIEERLAGKKEMTFQLVATGSESLAYTVDIACHVQTPESDDACPLQLTTRLTSDRPTVPIAAGQLLTVQAVMSNSTSQGLPMTVAIVGLPGGVEPRVDELDELQQTGAFDYYEIRGREVVFYWRTVAPKKRQEILFHVTAAIPGSYTGPASRVYPYYTAEQKQWVEPLRVEIEP